MKYKNHLIVKTNITTDVLITAKSGTYTKVAYLYEIQGRHKKNAGFRPFITSQKAAKEFINQMIEFNEGGK